MKLSTLLAPWMPIYQDCEILRIQSDSRQILPGDLFLAYPGTHFDARLYIPDVLAKGAAAVLYEPQNCPVEIQPYLTCWCIPLSHLMMQRGEIASRFYHYPTQSFEEVIAVTGTNGKTTIAYLLAQAFELLRQSSAYLGTLGQGRVNQLQATHNTTPDPICLQAFFALSRDEHVNVMCMEVSSHALVQGRVAGVEFSSAIYTNLSHEHLDYHQTLDAYSEAKSLLFAYPSLRYAIINQDDKYAALMKSKVVSSCQILTYGIQTPCDVRATQIEMSMTGSTFTVESPWGKGIIQTKLIGLFNIYNSLAILSQLLVSGYALQEVQHALQQLTSSPGRMEIVHEAPCVIVDYAHTPDALENVLLTLQKLKKRKLWVVFGCGGDRDKTKRPVMGKIASQYADAMIITSDNPRTEDPLEIIEEIKQGLLSEEHPYWIQSDRKQAIHQALTLAHPEDLILIAGKGHEDYQEIGKIQYPFSDQTIIRAFYSYNSGK